MTRVYEIAWYIHVELWDIGYPARFILTESPIKPLSFHVVFQPFIRTTRDAPALLGLPLLCISLHFSFSFFFHRSSSSLLLCFFTYRFSSFLSASPVTLFLLVFLPLLALQPSLCSISVDRSFTRPCNNGATSNRITFVFMSRLLGLEIFSIFLSMSLNQSTYK